jgi:hypothetical protein
MELIKYTDKSVVIKGDTKKYKEDLKKLGGRWNPNLTDKEGNKFGAWIFSIKKEPELLVFLLSTKKEKPKEEPKERSKSPETQEKKKASELLDMFGINSRKDFLLWSLKNHPDKGGKEEVYKRVSNWVDIVYGDNE